VRRCEPAVIACREHKKNHEIDVVVASDTPVNHDVFSPSASGEAGQPKLLLFARHGFTADLAAEAGTRRDVELINLHRLYHGT
jgi:uncharacterized protein